MIKTRQDISLGLLGKESGWGIGDFKIVDFSNVANAAATFRLPAFIFPVSRPGPAGLKAVTDNYPTEQGQSLAAIVNGRQVSTGSAPFAHLVEVFLVHETLAGGVFSLGAGTVQVKVISAFGVNVGSPVNLTGAFTGGVNGIDPITITAPADRQVSIEGTALTTAAALYNGDVVYVELVAAATVVGNIVAVGLGVKG
jgi:hypothetical protein